MRSSTNGPPSDQFRGAWTFEDRSSPYGRLFGIRIKTLPFWTVLFHVILFLPSILAHLPLFFGWGLATGLAAGTLGILLSIGISLLAGHRSYRREYRQRWSGHRNGSGGLKTFHRISDPVDFEP